jgi:purine-binding chemotaxis protein CheW
MNAANGTSIPAPAERAGGVDGAGAQHLTFMLRGEQFAIRILAVKEIIEYGQVTAVPMMPSWMRGVINLRGAVLPVVDLSARFSEKPAEITRRTCIVIAEVKVRGDSRDIGMIVDAVNAVLDIPASEIEPAPSMGAMVRSDFISGMGKIDGRFVIILNPERVLSESELATSGEVGGKPTAAASVRIGATP